MSIKNVLTAAMFKRDEAGRTLMYPNGGMGRGYVVPDAATEQRMRSALMWLVIGAGLFGGIGMQVMIIVYGQASEWTAEPWAVAFAALVGLCAGHRLVVRMLTRRLRVAQERMGVAEAMRRQAEAMPRWYLWFIAVFSPLMVVGSVAWMMIGNSVMKYPLGLVCIILFGATMGQAIYGLTRRPQT